MNQQQQTTPDKRRKTLLILEFSSLAVLLISMAWFSNQSSDGTPLSAGWLLIPAFASLGVFLSFIGLMYLRWVASANDQRRTRHRAIFALLTLTLLGVWIYGIANTWISLSTAQ
ncbi:MULTISPECIES: hypothetical protein [Marinobacter]|jgi:H+/Cl- antiporter ClcA|uniref:Voltage-gated chloride channel n=1 Tax=Marinobacter nauticus TaxID=2743 RepID=A0A368XIY0_MARNT|nr:hypothetical protein [Marinobacter nauticus]MCK5885890.1 hypothetical protein [Alcanivorax sp.]MEC9387813.1 hypothetical protein [Pseudomonadota bacterium]MCS5560810.1 hypothetical protein [Marinobacter nauticus]RCW67136.1 voltage-gated chloride channel [Marinobacter nauticus]CCG93870.1 putative membrane protein [Marinobacter nauticus ATCC 49840]